MKNKNSTHLTWGEFLKVLANFGVHVARSVVGGEILRGSHHDGDLWHARSKKFTEVKAAGVSAGAIIVGEQLERQCRDAVASNNDYAIVFYRNCGQWGKEGRCHLPFRMATSKCRLERFLLANLQSIYVVPADLIQAIYYSDPKRIKAHPMGKKGYEYVKIYRKVSPADLRKLTTSDEVLWLSLSLQPKDYLINHWLRRVRFGNYAEVTVPVYRVKPIMASDGLSFDVSSFSSTA